MHYTPPGLAFTVTNRPTVQNFFEFFSSLRQVRTKNFKSSAAEEDDAEVLWLEKMTLKVATSDI